jgi:hypothetical protein
MRTHLDTETVYLTSTVGAEMWDHLSDIATSSRRELERRIEAAGVHIVGNVETDVVEAAGPWHSQVTIYARCTGTAVDLQCLRDLVGGR